MKKISKRMLLCALLSLLAVLLLTSVAGAADPSAETAVQTAENASDSTGLKAIAAAITIGMTATVGALAMSFAISKSTEGISRQPEAADKIRTSLMLGLVFIETAIIYALIVAILIVFVL